MSENSGGGIGILGILGIVFVVLKLVHVINWPWLWVLAPFWGPLVLILVICAIVGTWVMLTHKGHGRR